PFLRFDGGLLEVVVEGPEIAAIRDGQLRRLVLAIDGGLPAEFAGADDDQAARAGIALPAALILHLLRECTGPGGKTGQISIKCGGWRALCAMRWRNQQRRASQQRASCPADCVALTHRHSHLAPAPRATRLTATARPHRPPPWPRAGARSGCSRSSAVAAHRRS